MIKNIFMSYIIAKHYATSSNFFTCIEKPSAELATSNCLQVTVAPRCNYTTTNWQSTFLVRGCCVEKGD